jgi:two-component system phosphate regulon sensor histidine kinase PhoR
MGLSRKTVWLIIFLMIVSLGGLIGLQASLLSDAMESKEATFRQNVMAAMGSVVKSLEATETIRATMHVVGDQHQIIISAETSDPEDCLTLLDTQLLLPFTPPRPPGDSLELVAYSLEHLAIKYDSEGETVDTVAMRPLPSYEAKGRRHVEGKDTGVFMFRYRTDTTEMATLSAGEMSPKPDLDSIFDSTRIDLISRVMDQLMGRQGQPLEKRVDADQLDSLVRQALDEYGIEMDPIWGIIRPLDSFVTLSMTDDHQDELLASGFKLPIFPHDILAAPNTLSLYFPGQGFYLLKQMGPLLIATFGFMAIVVFGFAYTVRTVVAQRRTTRLMVDFVNNMTHEFKTPISTVALACEAIMRPDVISDRSKVERFSGMIQQENRRMRHQAEKILQMAALEEKEGKFNFAPVDLHETVTNAIESITLQVDQRGGRIECRLRATRPTIEADAVHLTGIVYNLLDNAHKYSPEKPEILIATEDREDGIELIVEDHGVGLRPEDRRHIFEKYFRVSRGNLHDIKGFGLGLSYVSLMVKAHRGRIRVESEVGRGTRMILWFPSILSPSDGSGGSA